MCYCMLHVGHKSSSCKPHWYWFDYMICLFDMCTQLHKEHANWAAIASHVLLRCAWDINVVLAVQKSTSLVPMLCTELQPSRNGCSNAVCQTTNHNILLQLKLCSFDWV